MNLFSINVAWHLILNKISVLIESKVLVIPKERDGEVFNLYSENGVRS